MRKNILTVLLGNGKGSFTPGTNHLPGYRHTRIPWYCGRDFNKDGLVRSGYGQWGNDQVEVLLVTSLIVFKTPGKFFLKWSTALSRLRALISMAMEEPMLLLPNTEGNNATVLLSNGKELLKRSVPFRLWRQSFRLGNRDINAVQVDLAIINSPGSMAEARVKWNDRFYWGWNRQIHY